MGTEHTHYQQDGTPFYQVTLEAFFHYPAHCVHVLTISLSVITQVVFIPALPMRPESGTGYQTKSRPKFITHVIQQQYLCRRVDRTSQCDPSLLVYEAGANIIVLNGSPSALHYDIQSFFVINR